MAPRSNVHHVCFERRVFEADRELSALRSHPAMIVPKMDYVAHNKLLHANMLGMPTPSTEMVEGVMDILDEREFSVQGLERVAGFFRTYSKDTASFREMIKADHIANHIEQQIGYIVLTPLEARHQLLTKKVIGVRRG